MQPVKNRPKGLFLKVIILIILIATWGESSLAQDGTDAGNTIFLPGLSGSTSAPPPSSGSVYYLSPSGNDGNSGKTEAQAWATFNRAWEGLYPGDTLILLDGTYYQVLWPNKRNGEPGKPITIRAKNDGKAVIDGQGKRAPIQIGDAWPGPIGDYYVVEGLVARNSDSNVIYILGSHNLFRRVSAYDANTDENTQVININGSYNTFEDCVAAGTGRKMILVYGSHNNVIRRCFTYWKSWDGRNREECWPWGENINIYNGNDNIIENSIGYGPAPYRSISIISNHDKAQANGNKVLGTIAIGAGMNENGTVKNWGGARPQPSVSNCIRNFSNNGQRAGFEVFGQGELRNNLFQDIYAYGNAGLGFTSIRPYGPGPTGSKIIRATMRNNGLDNPEGPYPGMWGGVNTDALNYELSEFDVLDALHIDKIFVDWPNYPDGPRTLKTLKGEGARLDTRYVNGVMTQEPLWPWPMEGRIMRELGISVNGIVIPIISVP